MEFALAFMGDKREDWIEFGWEWVTTLPGPSQVIPKASDQVTRSGNPSRMPPP
jgi:hypothetical protein